MTGAALTEAGLAAAGRIAAETGALPLAQMSNARLERGAGRVPIDRLSYPVDQALDQLAGIRHVILVGTREPVAFFAYPGKPSRLAPEGAAVHRLAGPEDDLVGALAELAERLGAPRQGAPVAGLEPPARPSGALTGDKIALALAAVLPDHAIVADESVSVGRNFFALTRNARPHSWLQVTGGAIGCGLPLATGAAIACPERRVIALEADGSAMYTLQALWTQAREGLDVTTVILSNRSYAILQGEMRNVGVEHPGTHRARHDGAGPARAGVASAGRGPGRRGGGDRRCRRVRPAARAWPQHPRPVSDRGPPLSRSGRFLRRQATARAPREALARPRRRVPSVVLMVAQDGRDVLVGDRLLGVDLD